MQTESLACTIVESSPPDPCICAQQMVCRLSMRSLNRSGCARARTIQRLIQTNRTNRTSEMGLDAWMRLESARARARRQARAADAARSRGSTKTSHGRSGDHCGELTPKAQPQPQVAGGQGSREAPQGSTERQPTQLIISNATTENIKCMHIDIYTL
eukprot:COSAG05_NODE_7029_length_864_cov_4.432680_1_plen_157_part_00